MPKPEPCQKAGDEKLSRSEHVWFKRAGGFKCCLCGAVTAQSPPPKPTDDAWMPEKYEKLTPAERLMCPRTDY